MDAEMASWKSTGTYVDAVPPSWANIVDGMWIFRVKRPPGSPPAFKARYVARGFRQRLGRDYELHSLDFTTAFLQGSLHEEIWLHRPPGLTGSFPAGTQWSLRWPVYGLRQAPREWHDTLWTTIAALGFTSSTADPSLFLRTDTSLSPFYVLVYVDDLVFATVDTEALTLVMSELQKRHICTDLDSNSRPKQIRPARALDVVTKLSTPGVVKAGEAAVLSVKLPACLACTDTRTNDIRAGLTTPTRPTLNQPLTELLGRLGLAPTLLLLSLTTTRASTPRSRPATTSPTAFTAATPSAASTAATRAPTATTSPTAATTSTASTTSTAAPTNAPIATSTTTAATSTTPATLALAAAALRTRRSSTNVLSNRDVYSSSRSEGGGKGGGGAPLKEGRARSATSSTYSNCTSLSCEEMLLEEVNSEGGGVKGEKVVPDRVKRVREARDYEVEGDEHGGLVRGKKLSRDGSTVASIASAQVGNRVRYGGKRRQLREQVGQ
ncbi:unnamed protein product [Closterium sp. NIES-53]